MENKYPELERLKNIQEQSQLCGNFLEWLQTKYRMIGKRESFENGYIPFTYSSYINITELLAEYFDIDLNEVEKEKEQMLKDLSK
jgi:hypothetical protein